MGSFINSQSDNEICELLNKRFSDDIIPNDGRTYIRELRDFCSTIENLFDGNHNLHRVFYRLARSITGGPGVPKHNQSRFRWYHFLGSNLCPPNTRAAINTVLSNILAQNSNIQYATFLTRHVATGSHTFWNDRGSRWWEQPARCSSRPTWRAPRSTCYPADCWWWWS